MTASKITLSQLEFFLMKAADILRGFMAIQRSTNLAAIDDLIAQIEDKALRARLKEEADRLRREKKFGLVFEEHLPELTPIYSAEMRPAVWQPNAVRR